MDEIIVSIYDMGIGGADVWIRKYKSPLEQFCGRYVRADIATMKHIVNIIVKYHESEMFDYFDSLVGVSDRGVKVIICEDGSIDVYTRINKKWMKKVCYE